MFPPEFHGSTFNCLYTCGPNQKNQTVGHVVTSRDSFDIISRDWATVAAHFSVSDVEKVEIRGSSVNVSLKDGVAVKSVSFEPRPEKLKKLLNALTEVGVVHKPEIRFLALQFILPTFKFTGQVQMTLHKLIMDRTDQLAQTFQGSKAVKGTSGPLVDVFSCLYRLRFPNESTDDLETCVGVVDMMIRRHLLKVWCERLNACTKTSSPAAKSFVTKLSRHIMNTINKAANSLGLPDASLEQEVASYVGGGGGEGISSEANTLISRVEHGLKEDLQGPFGVDNVMLFLEMSLTILSGILVGMYPENVDLLVERCVEYTKTVVARGDVTGVREKLKAERQEYLSELLCFLDGQRYEEPFQYIYCIWDFDQISHMGF